MNAEEFWVRLGSKVNAEGASLGTCLVENRRRFRHCCLEQWLWTLVF